MIPKHAARFLLFLAVIVTASGMLVSDTPDKAVGKSALDFTLEDQFQHQWKWNDHWKGKPTVLVISDWKGSDHIENWTTVLTEQFKGRVQFAAIADLSLTQEAPSFMQGTLRNTIRSRFRDAYQYAILMDWDGYVCDHYLVQDGLPNVLYIDAAGVVRLHTWGRGSDEHVAKFAEYLERQL